MNTRRTILSMLLAIIIMVSPMLPWSQKTVWAQETQTLTMVDKKLYDSLKSSLAMGNNRGATIAKDDETRTFTLDMQKIKFIEIKNVDMTKENSRSILETLIHDCTKLSQLSLVSCNLSEFDLSCLNHKESLEILYLVRCRLDRVPDVTLPNLNGLRLSENNLSGEGALDNLTEEKLPHVTSLCLDGCQISEVDFLRNMGELNNLSLGNNRLTDDSLAALIGMAGENLSGLRGLNLGCTVHEGSGISSPSGNSTNNFKDVGVLASLPTYFPMLGNLDITGLGLTSLQEFASVRDDVSIDFKYNKICDFTGFNGDEKFDLEWQSISLSGDYTEGQESELPELFQRILDEEDVLAGTLKYTNCHLSEDGTGIVIETGAKTAYVKVAKGKLDESTIQFQYKRIPSYTVPQNLTATVGDTLAKVALPKGFAWKDAGLSVGAEGTNSFKAVYTPQDTDRYVVVDNIDVPVIVKAPVTEPPEPTDPVNPPEPTDPINPPEPTDPVDPPEPTDPVDPSEPTDPINPPKPPELTDPTVPITSPEMTEQERRAQEKRELAFNANLKVKIKGQNIHISWGRVPGADGYDVYVQYCYKHFNQKSITPVKDGRTTKVTVKKVNGKKLDLKKFCKVFVRAYKQTDSKKETLANTITAHVVGTKNTEYTNVKAIKLKKSSFQLKKGKSATIKARTVLVSKGKRQLTDKHAKQFRYATTNKKVATVSEKGKIKAVGKGSCTIYVYARNGYAKKIKVKVK